MRTQIPKYIFDSAHFILHLQGRSLFRISSFLCPVAFLCLFWRPHWANTPAKGASCAGGRFAPYLKVRCGRAVRSTTQRSTAQHSATQHSTVQHNTSSATQHSTAQCNTTQHKQRNTTKHSTIFSPNFFKEPQNNHSDIENENIYRVKWENKWSGLMLTRVKVPIQVFLSI